MFCDLPRDTANRTKFLDRCFFYTRKSTEMREQCLGARTADAVDLLQNGGGLVFETVKRCTSS